MVQYLTLRLIMTWIRTLFVGMTTILSVIFILAAIRFSIRYTLTSISIIPSSGSEHYILYCILCMLLGFILAISAVLLHEHN